MVPVSCARQYILKKEEGGIGRPIGEGTTVVGVLGNAGDSNGGEVVTFGVGKCQVPRPTSARICGERMGVKGKSSGRATEVEGTGGGRRLGPEVEAYEERLFWVV